MYRPQASDISQGVLIWDYEGQEATQVSEIEALAQI